MDPGLKGQELPGTETRAIDGLGDHPVDRSLLPLQPSEHVHALGPERLG